MQICKHVYKLPHSEQLSQPALPPSSNKRAHCSIRCQPLAQIQATGGAPLSPRAESHLHSSLSSISLFAHEATSLYSCLSASWRCRFCRGCPLHSSPPRWLDWGFERSALEINVCVMAAVTVIRCAILMKEWTASWMQINYPEPIKAQSQQDTSHTHVLTYSPFTLH